MVQNSVCRVFFVKMINYTPAQFHALKTHENGCGGGSGRHVRTLSPSIWAGAPRCLC